MDSSILIFAQTTAVDPISGGAGWVGAGLLGLVLAWLLMIHLPAKDKQLHGMIEVHSSSLRDLWEKKSTAIRELANTTQKSIETIVASSQKTVEATNNHCQIELEKVADAFKYELDRVFDVIIKRQTEMRERERMRDTTNDLRHDRNDRTKE